MPCIAQNLYNSLSIFNTLENIKEATKNKIEQLKMADELEKDGTSLKERRAKLWQRCANMTEILAEEETGVTMTTKIQGGTGCRSR